MATAQRTVEYFLQQVAIVRTASAKPIFGEYGVYVDGKMVGSICDDQLYIKPTDKGRAHAGIVTEASPYPGAKPCLVIDADRWDDADWLATLLTITAADLPAPKPKRSKRST
jgi:TfoX/Sxy family transcriptional regulator of competence genes